MARIILKSRYLRAGSKQHSEHLIQYIAKREGVQKIDDTWKHQPATKEQRKLIGELLRDFPEVKDSFEYADYLSKPDKGTASELISRAIDDNVDLIGKRENYVSYIAKRPRAERHGAHGLFTDADVPINLSQVAAEVAAQQEMETALRWASVDNRPLYNRYRHTKKKRIRKKYAKRILEWYRTEVAPC